MDRIRKARTPVRASITKVVNELDAERTKAAPDKDTLEIKLIKLNKLVEEVEELDQKMKDQHLDGNLDDKEYAAELTTVEDYYDKVLVIRHKVSKIISPSSPSPSTRSSDSSDNHKKNYKLPKIELIKFDGELKNWLEWWAQFEKIHVDSDLHTTDKFHYLTQSMVSGTRAADVVKSYPKTEENYQKAVDALRERFGKEDLLVDLYARELVDILTKREKLPLSKLYDSLQTQLQALASLGVKSERDTLFLRPMIETCVPKEILTAWYRSTLYDEDLSTSDPPKTKLDNLMQFLRQEVEREGKLKMVYGQKDRSKDFKKKDSLYGDAHQEDVATAAGLSSTSKIGCVFCDKINHMSQDCFKARTMTMEQRNDKLKEKKVCFRCLKSGHISKKCSATVKCGGCGNRHHLIMCRGGDKTERQPEQPDSSVVRHNNFARSNDVLLKVVVVRAMGARGSRTVRMLIDEGSQVSYVGTKTVKVTGSKSTGVEHVRNMLLGGYVTDLHEEHLREVEIENLAGTIKKNWILREKSIVCTSLPRVPVGPWLETLKKKKINISDLATTRVEDLDIEILIGSDLRGQVMTGRNIDLGGDLFAEETIFGWALGGPVPVPCHSNVAIALCHRQFSLQDLWSLDTLGITDSIQVKSKSQEDEEAKKHFIENVTRKEDGRYCVGLPWISEKPDLPSNRTIAEKRLQSTTKKLKDNVAVNQYSEIFRGWEKEGIVEPVNVKSPGESHYLPHHPVFKPESQTTPVRPVFDASCKVKGQPSLNDCLYKGPNLIELIPAVLHRFRQRKIGVVSDIRKAFQMIEVREEDRDYQRFLWWDENMETIKELRHARVVFGETCSPFLLGGVLELHLSQVEEYMKIIAKKLLKSMYVDNSITSFDTTQEYEDFRAVSTKILADAKMDLREWECSKVDVVKKKKTNVLGLAWDRSEDTLSCEVQPVVIQGPLT